MLLQPAAAQADVDGKPCRLDGLAHEARCFVVKRALDPDDPRGRSIDVHVALLPSLARNKHPDPIFFFAGGPGQSAIDLAGTVQAMLGRFSNRRDIVLIDQRGTGRSAPLICERPDPWRALAQAADPDVALDRLRACAKTLQTLPHGDLRFYTTTIATGDADAVRQTLGVERVNLIGGSYGTRAALEYMRLYPQHVRSAVLDGVAPADMRLAASFSADNQMALDAMFAACRADEACRSRYPDLDKSWGLLLSEMPKNVTMPHPVGGQIETFQMSRQTLLGLVRTALYVPSLTAALPAAIDAASRGRFAPLAALSQTPRRQAISEGMHFAVVCSEDAPGEAGHGEITPPGRDFGESFERTYAEVCKSWPKGKVSDSFYSTAPAPAPTLVLSGGTDPATPSRHGERVAKRLGERATHLVVPHAGHGLMGYACVREAVYRFVDGAVSPTTMPAPTLDCAQRIPRALAYRPPAPDASAARGTPPR